MVESFFALLGAVMLAAALFVAGYVFAFVDLYKEAPELYKEFMRRRNERSGKQ